jgi:chaperonin GroEL (HSP60 family)
MILGGGAIVVLCSGGIDDLCLKYFVEANAIGVRRVRRAELDAIAKATGGSVLTSLADLDGTESFDPKSLGHAKEVTEDRVADDDAIFIKEPATSSAVSLLLRGPSDYALDEMERSLNDALHALSATLESDAVVVGGGAVDVALNVYIEKWAQKVPPREQIAAKAWADALLTIPKLLSTNAAKDATELIAQMRHAHAPFLAHIPEILPKDAPRPDPALLESGRDGDPRYLGLDLKFGAVADNLKRGVLEPAAVKITALQLATDAAVVCHICFVYISLSFLPIHFSHLLVLCRLSSVSTTTYTSSLQGREKSNLGREPPRSRPPIPPPFLSTLFTPIARSVQFICSIFSFVAFIPAHIFFLGAFSLPPLQCQRHKNAQIAGK